MKTFILTMIVLLVLGGITFIGFGAYLKTLEIGIGGMACLLLAGVLGWRSKGLTKSP